MYEELGKGSFGRVHRVVCIHTETAYALKFMEFSEEDDEGKALLVKEAEMMAQLPPHPNIVRYYLHWEEGTDICVLLELCEGGDVQDFICAVDRPLPEPNVKERLF